ncbi:MAG: TraM recognition domain-containing protein, partial [Planctomycetaceae bacterium]
DLLRNPNSQHASQILDSTRNRLKPYFESKVLQRMFGSTESRLDVQRMMRDARIVIVDLAPRGRLFETEANTIGALLLNEVLAVARSMPRDVKYPTFLLLDEFQNFVGPDIESALPEVRQLGLRMILSHQSLSQLERGDHDLTAMIFQAQSRMIFGVQGEDADLLAHEVASLSFDPRKIKDEHWTRRQLISGHRIQELSSWSEGETAASQWNESYGKNWSSGRNRSHRPFAYNDRTDVESHGNNEGKSEGHGHSESMGHSKTRGSHQTLVPVYENFRELASRTYTPFDEQKQEWASFIRRLKTGQALIRTVNDPEIRVVNVKRSTPGVLGFDMHTIARRFPEALERLDQLVEDNFHSDFFVPAEQVDREAQRRIEAILYPKIAVPEKKSEPEAESPFSE